MLLNCARSIQWGLSLGALAFVGLVLNAPAQIVKPDGAEYPIVGSYLGDQVFSAVAYNGSYGFAVWQDSKSGGKNSGIVARQLSGDFNASVYPAFHVSQGHPGDHERPRVALFPKGETIFTWHGGPEGQQKVYARFLSTKGAFVGPEVAISQSTAGESLDAAVTILKNGMAVVTWSSRGPDGDMMGVFGRFFGANGAPVGSVFQVNQFTPFNQRNAQVSALSDGGFAVVWISEQQRKVAGFQDGFSSVDVYARLYDGQGVARGDEFRVNSEDRVCANPDVGGTPSGGFTIAWSQRSGQKVKGWDIFAAHYSVGGARITDPAQVNTFDNGDQVVPSISTLGERQMVVWTSHGQDGSGSGIYGQVLVNGVKAGAELGVNSWTIGKQIQPAAGSDGKSRFVVLWSTFMADRGFDLHAQRYSSEQGVPTPEAPMVSGLSQSSVQGVWSDLEGYPLANYEVSVDGGNAVTAQRNSFVASSLAPGSTHQLRIRYVLKDGETSEWSAPGSGTTWGADDNFDGLPDDWQALYWGADASLWPKPGEDSDGDGMSNAAEFLAGTDPRDAASVLRVRVERSAGGSVLTWNTVPGLLYQVQRSGIPPTTWQDLGSARLSRGTSDTLRAPVDPAGASYRVMRVR